MDELHKESMKVGIVAFNIAFIFVQIFNGFVFGQFTIAKLFLGLLLGGAAAAGGYFGYRKLNGG